MSIKGKSLKVLSILMNHRVNKDAIYVYKRLLIHRVNIWKTTPVICLGVSCLKS